MEIVMKQADEIKRQVKLYEKNILEQIGSFIHNRRKEKGVLIKDLNIMTGVGTAVISDLENAESMPRIETLLRICEALEISFPTLFEQMKHVTADELKGSKIVIDNTNKYDRLSTYMAGLGFSKEDVADIVSYARFIDFKKKGK